MAKQTSLRVRSYQMYLLIGLAVYMMLTIISWRYSFNDHTQPTAMYNIINIIPHSQHNTTTKETTAPIKSKQNMTLSRHILQQISQLNEDNLNIKQMRPNMNPHYTNIHQLNDDLLCSVNLTDTGQTNLLKHLYRLQYPPDCDPTKRKFLIWKHSCNVGIFANLHCIAFQLAAALILNRTLIIHGKWTFYDKIQCPLNLKLYSSMDCFFLPISNCTMKQVLYSDFDRNLSISSSSDFLSKIDYPLRHNKMDNTFDIIYLKWTDYYHLYSRAFQYGEWLKTYYNSSGFSTELLRSILGSYIFRMQPYIGNVVELIMEDVYYTSNVDLGTTVAMMIRWGDKCKQSAAMKKKAESYCTTYRVMMNVMAALKVLDPDIETIVATSDTKDVIHNLTRDYTQWMDNEQMRFILNKYDIMPNTSLHNKYRTIENIYSVMVSILSSIKLQFGAKYYFVASASSWSATISEMAQLLHCAPENNINIKRLILQFPSKKLKKANYELAVKIARNQSVIWPQELSAKYFKKYGNRNWDKEYNIVNIWTNDNDTKIPHI